MGEQLRAKLRVEVLPDRLHKALALVLNTYEGHVTYGPVAEAHGLSYVKVEEVLG